MNLSFFLIKNKTGTFGNPRSRLSLFDLELIRPEYTCPSGYLGVRAGVCIRQNMVYITKTLYIMIYSTVGLEDQVLYRYPT